MKAISIAILIGGAAWAAMVLYLIHLGDGNGPITGPCCIMMPSVVAVILSGVFWTAGQKKNGTRGFDVIQQAASTNASIASSQEAKREPHDKPNH